MTMKRALVIFSGQSFGGAERRFARLSAYLIARGQDIVLILTADAWETIRAMGFAIPDDYCHIIDAPSAGGFLQRKINRLSGLIRMLARVRRGDIGQVHFAMNPGLIPFLYACLGKSMTPYSVSMVDSIFEYRTDFIGRLIFKRTVRAAQAIDCLSPHLKDVSQSIAGQARYAVCPCSFTDYAQVEIAPVRDIDVAMISRWVPAKGIDLLEKAAIDLNGLNIHVCGAGPLKPDIPSASLYEAKQPFQVLGRSKIFLSLQQYNNYPSQSLLEAMGSGCAIIATDVGETRLLLDETCAMLIPYDADALAAAIKTLMQDDSLRQRLAAAAQRKALETQTIDRFADYFLRDVMPERVTA